MKRVPSPCASTATSCNIVPNLGNCACQPASSTSAIIMFRCRFPSTRRSATYAVTPHCAVIPGSKSRRLPSAGQWGSGWAPPGRAELGLRPPERSSSPRWPVCAGTERRGPCKALVATRGHALLGLIQNACSAPSLTPTLPPSRHPDACIVKARRAAVQAFFPRNARPPYGLLRRLGQSVVQPRVEDSGLVHCERCLTPHRARNGSRVFNARLLARRCKGFLG